MNQRAKSIFALISLLVSLFIMTCPNLFALSAKREKKEAHCSEQTSWLSRRLHRLHQVWTMGNPELYFSGYAWHNRYTYSINRLKTYNEQAWGGGFGKGFYDEDGDWHGLSAIAFLDSHKNLEPAVGYGFFKIAKLNNNIRLGAGYSILVTVRPDIFKGVPFPGILPWLSLNYHKLTLLGTYIPGAQGAGNVCYVLGKWTA